MKVKIRKKVFETNSSSIHSFCIYKGEQNLNIPECVTLQREDFGWGNSYIRDTNKKLNYFYEMCIHLDDNNGLIDFKDNEEPFKENSLTKKFIDYLENNGIIVDYYLGNDYYEGSIDHCDDYCDLAKCLLENDNTSLDDFLFGDKSLVVTTNDNLYEEDQYHAPIEKEYNVFYKGN